MAPIRVHFDGKVFVPDEPVDLPAGTPAETIVSRVDGSASDTKLNDKSPLQDLADLLAQFPPNPDAPADGAAQHDHYIYGTPKRS